MHGDVAEANIWRKKNSRCVKKSGSRPNAGMKIRDFEGSFLPEHTEFTQNNRQHINCVFVWSWVDGGIIHIKKGFGKEASVAAFLLPVSFYSKSMNNKNIDSILKH